MYCGQLKVPEHFFVRFRGHSLLLDNSEIRVECRVQDTGYRIQDTGYKIQDTGYRIQDTGYRIQDTGYRIHKYRIKNVWCCRIQDSIF